MHIHALFNSWQFISDEIRSTGRYLGGADRMRAAFLDETRAHASASRSRIGEIHWPVDISIINR